MGNSNSNLNSLPPAFKNLIKEKKSIVLFSDSLGKNNRNIQIKNNNILKQSDVNQYKNNLSIRLNQTVFNQINKTLINEYQELFNRRINKKENLQNFLKENLTKLTSNLNKLRYKVYAENFLGAGGFAYFLKIKSNDKLYGIRLYRDIEEYELSNPIQKLLSNKSLNSKCLNAVCKLYDYGTTYIQFYKFYYSIMELGIMDLENFYKILKEYKKKYFIDSFNIHINIIISLLQKIKCIHKKGIIHFDVKTDNIVLFEGDENNFDIYLDDNLYNLIKQKFNLKSRYILFKFIDFGISKKINELPETSSKYVKYNNEYYLIIFNKDSNEVMEVPGTSYFKINSYKYQVFLFKNNKRVDKNNLGLTLTQYAKIFSNNPGNMKNNDYAIKINEYIDYFGIIRIFESFLVNYQSKNSALFTADNKYKFEKLEEDFKNSSNITNNKKGNILNFIKNNLFIDENTQMVSCLKSKKSSNTNEYYDIILKNLLELRNQIIPVGISLRRN